MVTAAYGGKVPFKVLLGGITTSNIYKGTKQQRVNIHSAAEKAFQTAVVCFHVFFFSSSSCLPSVGLVINHHHSLVSVLHHRYKLSEQVLAY